MQSLPVKTKQRLLDHGSVLLELDTKVLGVECTFKLLDSLRFVELDLDSERLLGLDRVDSQIVSGSVGTSDAFDPAVRGLDLEIPTVLWVSRCVHMQKKTYSSVMSHLVGHVLPAPQPLWVDTDLDQEELSSSKEITKSLVVDNTLWISLVR